MLVLKSSSILQQAVSAGVEELVHFLLVSQHNTSYTSWTAHITIINAILALRIFSSE